jgi:hypothetical protein
VFVVGAAEEARVAKVMILQLDNETLKLREEADRKAALLLARMIEATDRVIGAEFDAQTANDEIVALQRDYATWVLRAERFADLLEDIHANRAEFWASMPEGKPTMLVADKNDGACTVVLFAERRHASVLCRNFEMYERDANGEVEHVVLQSKTG